MGLKIMNEIVIKENVIQNMIYEVRGVQVMLDSDLAKLYGCANGTKDINKAVKRNIDKFPEDFYFQLTKEEYYNILRFQNGTLELEQGKYSKYLPYAFTEEGVAMLSGVLHTDIAVEISKKIIRTFVAMRHFIGNNLLVQNSINNIVIEDHNRINKLENAFKQFEEKKKVNEIYYNGQIFDAYSKIKSIFKEANKELIIVDAYADISVLDIIKELNVNVKLIVKTKGKLTSQDITNYNKQYNNLNIYYCDDFHDRYFILDKTIIYHCGASINYAGNKIFSINLLEDEIVKSSLINKIISMV